MAIHFSFPYLIIDQNSATIYFYHIPYKLKFQAIATPHGKDYSRTRFVRGILFEIFRFYIKGFIIICHSPFGADSVKNNLHLIIIITFRAFSANKRTALYLFFL